MERWVMTAGGTSFTPPQRFKSYLTLTLEPHWPPLDVFRVFCFNNYIFLFFFISLYIIENFNTMDNEITIIIIKTILLYR